MSSVVYEKLSPLIRRGVIRKCVHSIHVTYLIYQLSLISISPTTYFTGISLFPVAVKYSLYVNPQHLFSEAVPYPIKIPTPNFQLMRKLMLPKLCTIKRLLLILEVPILRERERKKKAEIKINKVPESWKIYVLCLWTE